MYKIKCFDLHETDYYTYKTCAEFISLVEPNYIGYELTFPNGSTRVVTWDHICDIAEKEICAKGTKLESGTWVFEVSEDSIAAFKQLQDLYFPVSQLQGNTFHVGCS